MNSHQRRIRARANERQGKSAPVLASLGRPVTLLAVAEAAVESTGPVWVECCLSGTYLGHPKADKLDWGPPLFDILIANLHGNPNFKAGADGVGCVPVIPWDYEHESEIAKMTNKLPPEGLPARAWTYDFAVRPGADGTPSFWALTEFLPQSLQQVRNREYRWCSIAVAPHIDNPVTGVDQGPTVTSIALTNDPFIQGMVPLAATRRGVSVNQTLDQWGPAESLAEALIGLRKIFEVDDDAPPEAVLEQLKTLRGLIESGTVPEYLGIENVLDRMRRLLEIPLLALPSDILGGAEAIVRQLITGGSTADPSAPVTELGEPQMAAPTLNVALASRFKCAEDDGSILLAVAKKEDAAAAGADATDAFGKLKQLLGGDDMATTIANCTKLMADAKQCGPLLEALNAAQAALKGNADADATNESGLVAASIARGDANFEKQIHPVILAARRSCIEEKKNEHGITIVSVNEATLTKFRADYPLPAEQVALLTRRVVAGPNGTQLRGPITGYNTQPIMQAQGASSEKPALEKLVADINATPGTNPVAKCITLFSNRDAKFKALDWADKNRVAGAAYRSILQGNLPTEVTL